jgi:Flp pilus assembly protein TadD
MRSDEECEQLYRSALTLHQNGQFAEAATLYRTLLAERPDFPDAHCNLGSILKVQGKLDEAISAFTHALTLRPSFATAHYNLGNALREQGRLDEAIACYQSAVVVKPDFAQAYNNLGNVYRLRGQFADALTAYRDALAARPSFAEAHLNSAIALEQQGLLTEAEIACRRALALAPDYIIASKHLGAILCELGRTAEGFESFLRYAKEVYGTNAKHPPAPAPTAAHKSRHDAEQRRYIQENGGSVSNFDVLRLEGGARLSSPAINPNNDDRAISNRWKSATPQLVVIDNLLSPDALMALRRLCWGSTFWRQSFEGGYLGALPEHGFAVPLLAQVSEELRICYPEIFQNHPLLQIWAFKYDSHLSGIKLHADFAAVNVNFWITPDEANLDPDSGGLVVWDKAAPLDWDFKKYNTGESEIRAFLKNAGANSITVPYRANRAVVFDSDLFHETDSCTFKDGYCDRRINITLLYGWRSEARDNPVTPWKP